MDLIKERLTLPEADLGRSVTKGRVWSPSAGSSSDNSRDSDLATGNGIRLKRPLAIAEVHSQETNYLDIENIAYRPAKVGFRLRRLSIGCRRPLKWRVDRGIMTWQGEIADSLAVGLSCQA
ncbi:hypothetical protein [Sphingobium yanoikuyae]|jgi:hypothetical protein|uniref:hypothetical protein n=1 Tax=Sphingobium yanoikuyae TaxID=13690 RepID=UPI00131EFA5D|nr:hypothetical protein [Sphingobium yanoikuyae]